MRMPSRILFEQLPLREVSFSLLSISACYEREGIDKSLSMISLTPLPLLGLF